MRKRILSIFSCLILILVSVFGLTACECKHESCSWRTISAATCDKQGERQRICSDCGARLNTSIIESPPHVPSDWIIDEHPTYNSKGLKHKECLECNTVLEYQSIEELGTGTLQSQKIAKNRDASIVIDLSEDRLIVENDITIEPSNVKVVANGSNVSGVEVLVNNNVITIKTALIPTGSSCVKIVAKNGVSEVAYEKNLEVIDYAIGTVNELNTFIADVKNAVRGNKSWAVELTANINYNFANTFVTRNSKNNDLGYFTGTFDGNGYTISNIMLNGNALFWGVENATIKNVAFTHVNKSGGVVGSIFIWNSYGANVIENVYVQALYDTTGIEQTASGLICEGKDFTLNNVIINVEFSDENKYNAINYWQGEFLGDNVYAISQTAKSLCSCTTHKGNVGLYMSVQAFKNGISSESLQSFDSNFWNVKNGVPEWIRLGS